MSERTTLDRADAVADAFDAWLDALCFIGRMPATHIDLVTAEEPCPGDVPAPTPRGSPSHGQASSGAKDPMKPGSAHPYAEGTGAAGGCGRTNIPVRASE